MSFDEIRESGMNKSHDAPQTGDKPGKKRLPDIFRKMLPGGQNRIQDQDSRVFGKNKKIPLKTRLKGINAKTIKKNYLRIAVVILFAALILSRTVGHIRDVFFKEDKISDMVEFMEIVPVKVYQVKRMDFKDTLPVMGRIEGFKQIALRFSEAGVLENYNFEEGERILQGDIVASLDQKDALLRLRYASIEQEKAQKLFNLGGIEQMALDQKQLEYESARRELEKTNIYAHGDGYLGSKDIHTGSYVTPQDKIGTFVDFREVYAAFNVIEEDSTKVRLGQNVDVFVDALAGQSFRGRIDVVAPVITGRTRTQSVKVELTNREGELKPGMFARAVINTYEKPDALIIPASAFRREDNKFFVYVVNEEKDAGEAAGRVEVREVTIEYLTHDVAEVGQGLSERELIIRELHQEYRDDDMVEITEIQETIF